MKNKNKIVVLCGSSKFVDIMAVCAWLIEREEAAITLGLHFLPVWYRSPDGSLPPDHLAEREGCASQMDELHLRKIDLADEIFVIDFGGYVGPSTSKEILYAIGQGKTVRKLSEEPKIREMVARMILEHYDPQSA